MRYVLCLIMTMTLSGCLGNISFDGLAATGGATACATAGAIVSPETALIGGLVCGVTTDIVTTPSSVDPTEVESFYGLIAYMWQNFTSHLIGLAVVLSLVWIITGYLGLRAKRPEEKNAEKQISLLIDKIGKMKE